MSRYIITGGKQLKGEVSIRGAKNASFKQIIASMLTDEKVFLNNVPQISDVRITTSIAKNLGCQVNQTGDHCFELTTPKIINSTVPQGTGEKSRTSFMFAAPLLARTGTAIVPIPGGDKLGARPLDRLFECFAKMNIKVSETENNITFTTDKIIGTNYTFIKPSHTVTEVIIMTAVLASGETILNNAAIEPEIDDLILILNKMGAKIERDPIDNKKIIIQGVSKLKGTRHDVICDRNEIVTFACAALATKGSVCILRIKPDIVKTFLEIIEKMGAQVKIGNDEICVQWVKTLTGTNIETGPEPEFMTDWQAIFTVLLTQTVGCSSIIEKVYPNRFQHIENLKKMGVKVKFFNPGLANPENYYQFNKESDRPEYFHGVKIYGPTRLKAANFVINDLRAGASATIAALTAPGKSIIDGVEYIERGYEKLAERLWSLGANIEYIKT
ncbi:MAG: UDP-N-acetylglucosamine 1-carboxyvinyltransferase [Candidatus Shapirobacteria bacterium]|jgi:UDP-N-acetylglucosamine 1-carboxyvinyltransferase|nr:UDP-N-acetylglucosamine 1-carboxyvinyltransferase [Candidatus Shapirobacteria bacterium]